jgi:hypothetical protein
MRRIVIAALLGASCVVGGTARADEMRPGSTDVPAASEAAPPAEVAQAKSEIEATLAQMRTVSLRVRDDLRATRRRGTKAQITCVDQALSRADVATRRVRETGDEMLAAYGRGEIDLARAARRRVVEIRESQRVAARDGASCSAARGPIGQQPPTTVKVDVDPRIPPAP